jgi:surface carbohydrate biosynthesis protein
LHPRICLIVDNPLRDLDGLVLLAWHLARRGAETYLVPMYAQGFDVPSIAPDLVVANYVRPNNRDLLLQYRRRGILVGVLDTEGAAGKDADQFAGMVARMDCASFIDVYCVWGTEQYDAFRRAEIVPADRLRLTGCPRFDFCSMPWRAALPQPTLPNFILINTNFPTVNPRFSRGCEDETKSMVAAGFSEAFARMFIADARRAYEGILSTTEQLLRDFPDVKFVLRPHPFEDPAAYLRLRGPNLSVRQEGSALEWIALSRLLIHQNCSTALEAVMMGVEPLSLDWLNTPALALDGPTLVSQRICSYDALRSSIERTLSGASWVIDESRRSARRDVIAATYFSNDGQSAARVADALLEMICASGTATCPLVRRLPRPSLRGSASEIARRVLGYDGVGLLKSMVGGDRVRAARTAKSFSAQQVGATLTRIAAATGEEVHPTVTPASAVGGQTLRVDCAAAGEGHRRASRL